MSPNQIRIGGKWLATLATILGAIAFFIASLNPTLLQKDWGEIIITFGVFIASLSTYLAHESNNPPKGE